MIRCTLMALAVLTTLAACKTTDSAMRTPNPGSHSASYIHTGLLPGRVAVQFETWTGDWKNWFVTSAIYQHPDGRSLECWGHKRRYREEVFDGYRFSHVGEDYTAATRDPDTGALNPVFYNPQTGRLHVEEWDPARGDWFMRSDGWVQESWPRLMADACPDLPIPAHVPINEAQTHPTIWKMMEQDPEAPYRRPIPPPTRLGIAAAHSGDIWYWCFKAPNRPELPAHCPFDTHERNRGIDSAGGGTEPAAALSDDPEHAATLRLAALLKANNGKIVTDALGREYVLALHAEGDELWAVDRTGEVLDIGHLAWNAAARRIELDWETYPATRDYVYRPGEAMPLRATGRSHPLFALADWLVKGADDVVLPYMGRQALFRFEEGGALTVRGVDRDASGAWLVSRGRLILEVDGIAGRAAYRWDLLARHLEAHAGYEADAG